MFRTQRSLPSALLLAASLAAIFVSHQARADGGSDATSDALRQVAGILDYIAGDYRDAVDARGQITNDAEYQEQLSLARDASALAERAGLASASSLRRALAELSRALTARERPEPLAARCRAARELLVTEHGLVLGPREQPSFTRGESLYGAHGCATCHGTDGSADTEAARKLDPRPANFRDPQRVAAVSPHRAFYAISYGVAGTGMTGYPQLAELARWDLAFYVMGLRHASRDAEQGRELLTRTGSPAPTDASTLAGLTDEDLAQRVGPTLSGKQSDAALSYLRRLAPFEARATDAYARALRELDSGLSAHASGQTDAARQHFIAAYLDGFEPNEAALGARDPKLVREVERAMLALREQAARGASHEALASQVAQVRALLERARAKPDAPSAAFWGALAITLREGLEAVLLVSALLMLVRRRAPELVKYLHAGWAAALVAGGLTFAAAGHLLSGMQRELAEGIAALLAAIVLLGVTHWLVGQLSAQRFMSLLAERFELALRGGRAAFGVAALSFIAVYREAFEVVLFFQALLLEAKDSPERVLYGILVGLLALAATALTLKYVGKRLRPRPLMLASSVLLALLSFTLTGKGVRALQEGALVPITSLPLPELPTLGIYATTQGLCVQGALVLALLASAAMPWLASRRQLTNASATSGRSS